MLDWLRRRPSAPPVVTIGECRLPVTIRRLPQAKQMTLRVAPDGSEIRISIPRWARDEDALDFVTLRKDWIAAQLAHQAPRVAIGPGKAVPYRGTPHALHHDPALPRRIGIDGGTIRIGGPADGLDKRLARWLQAESRGLFAADLADYCHRAGVTAPALALSSAQARWGSCSARGVVRINWRLVMAPDAVRRSVVAHEVAHLVHFNHSPAFHALLAQVFEGDVADANGWLKRHGRGLYAPFG